MLLVVVIIGLLAMLGASFLQVARVQRQTEPDPIDNIDLVLRSVIEEIQIQMRADIFDPATGVFFSEAGGIEPYDRVWTNDGSTYPVYGIDGVSVVGQASGGRFDDTWLASALPFDDSGTWKWRQITTLTGGFYDADGVTPIPNRFVDASVQGPTGPDRRVGNGTALVDGVDFNLNAFGDPNLVDADADGMGDSRWERAPLALKDGIEYFMAVRIIDLSSFVNTNVALSAIDNTGTYDTSMDGKNAPRAWQPGEVDLGRYVFEYGPGYMGELNGNNGLLDVRGIADTAARPLQFGAVRQAFWEEGPRHYGDFQAPAVPLLLDNETELRYRMSTRNFPDATPTLEATMPSFMALNVPNADLNGNLDADGHFTYTATTREVPRLRMTTQSAEAIFAPTLPGETPTTRVLQLGLNNPIFNIDPATANATQRADLATALNSVSNVVQLVYNAGAAPTVPPTVANSAEMGDQLAAALQDYRDTDNRLTDVGGRYGMEALPFIGEVYVQRPYAATAAVPNAAASAFTITWAADPLVDGDAGYAFEIRNPFNRPVRLDGVYLFIDDNSGVNPPVAVDTNPLDPLDPIDDLLDLVGAAAMTAHNNANLRVDNPDTAADEREMLWPGDVLVIYRNSGDELTADPPSPVGDDVATLLPAAVAPPTVIRAELPVTPETAIWPDYQVAGGTPKTWEPVTVELRATRAEAPPPADLLFDPEVHLLAYHSASSISMPDEIEEENSTEDHFAGVLAPGTPDEGYLQASDQGTHAGLNMLAMQTFEADFVYPEPATAPGTDPRDTTLEALAEDKPMGMTTIAAGTSQVLIADDENNRLRHVGELANVALIGPTATQTVPQVWNTTTPIVGDLYLAIDPPPANPVIDTTGSPAWNVPHGMFLLSRFTTLSPAVDNVDNNGFGGTDEDLEQKLLGRLNLNQAETQLLADVLPFATGGVRNAIATSTETERGDTPPLSAAPGPGLVLPWQLWNRPGLDAMIVDTGDTQGFSARLDFRQNYRETATDPIDDGIADDREELSALMSMLGQVATTRSDVYVAYILVHGYEATDFAAGPVETGRMIVMFDRTNLLTNDDAVQYTVLYRFP